MDEREAMTGGGDVATEAELQELFGAAGPRPELPAAEVRAVESALRQAWARRAASRRPRPPYRWLALAAALTIALGAVAWWLAARPAHPVATALVAHVTTVAGDVTVTAAGGEVHPLAGGAGVPAGATVCTGGTSGGADRAALALASGVALRLDGGTCLEFAAPAAVALSRGAVYADTGVAPGPGATVAVATPFGVVRDVGTRFAVRLLERAGEPVAEVRVRAGEVVVDRPSGRHGATAGEELVVHRDGRVERRPAAAFGSGWEWVLAAAPGFEIEGGTLADLLRWVVRETGWQLRFADPALAAASERIVLHGDIGRLRPDEAAFAVLPGAGLEGTLQGEALIIARREP